MRKIKTLFKREFVKKGKIITYNEVEKGCEWVLSGEGNATKKWDGTCVLLKDGYIYKRFDYKNGRKLPDGAIPCQEKADEITGHFPHWVKCEEFEPADKWHIKAFKEYCEIEPNYEEGTYELIGKHFNGNKYNIVFGTDVLKKHGDEIIEVKRSFDGIKEYLRKNKIEGLVFHRRNGDMCKIKRTDFGFEW